VGIGGIGMCGIAEVLLNLGYRVSGSDMVEGPALEKLRALGAAIHLGHDASHLGDADVLVYSSAVPKENPEIMEAKRRGIPVIPRAEMLAELMRLKYGIAVAGAHGKTTTTSMIATILARGGLDPTAVIGGRLNSLGGSAKLGQGDYLVAEADESDGSFLKLTPTIAVVTNLDREHLDHYADMEEIQRTFLQFINKVPFYGLAVLCLDDPYIPQLLPDVEKRVMTYGLNPQADLHAVDLQVKGLGCEFMLILRGQPIGSIEIPLLGSHNVLNALAAVCVALELDISFSSIKEALEGFEGVHRRFQVRYRSQEIMLVDDYGHHPTEIRATLKAAKEALGKRLVVVFQPHRYSRTYHLWDDFLTAFYEADVLHLLDIYPAGEASISGIDSRRLSEELSIHGHRNVHYRAGKEEVVERIMEDLRPGDLVLTLGAGDVWKVAEELQRRLEGRSSKDVIHGGL
jgi:UDP-N-acetylmuramate--alanine ligase